MAAFIIRALHPPGYIPPTPEMQRFPDVPPTNAFYAHIVELTVIRTPPRNRVFNTAFMDISRLATGNELHYL
jgi:hypothetical protein